jgi:hypothetical protein
MMLMVVWNPSGFHLIDVIRKDSKFEARHSISQIPSPLREILGPYPDDPRSHFMIQAANSRPYYSKTLAQF